MSAAFHSLRRALPADLSDLLAIDEDAGLLYRAAGITVALPPEHPFVCAERARWQRSIAAGLTWIAMTDARVPVGFAVCGYIDGAAHLDQLAVARPHMRRGVGAGLLRQAIAWSAGGDLWLTTYAHIPWNRPYYERVGFLVMPEGACGPEVRATLLAERAVLPLPRERVAMRLAPT